MGEARTMRAVLEPPAEARLGLVALSVDETLEPEFRRLLPAEVLLHVTRVPSGRDLTPETIAAMASALPEAAGRLPPEARFGAVAYACTSGAALLGAERVAALVREGAPRVAAVTDPLTAAVRALKALGARRVGLVTPYVASVSAGLRAAFAARGIETPAVVSFGERREADVARIAAASVAEAARAVAPGMDAVFLSCTNLRTLDVAPDLETELGLPVVSSNLALAWEMTRLAGLAPPDGRFGRLVRGAALVEPVTPP